MDLRQRQHLAMELFQMVQERDPLRNPEEVAKLSRNRFCFLYARSLGLAMFAFLFMFLTYNTKDMVDALTLLLNSTLTS
jgi:hypothetical protein